MAKVIHDRNSGETVLYMSEDEAATLTTLLYCHIAGPDDGPRGILTKIGSELNDAGVQLRDHFRIDLTWVGHQVVYLEA